jgi:hypothetical protein
VQPTRLLTATITETDDTLVDKTGRPLETTVALDAISEPKSPAVASSFRHWGSRASHLPV